MKIGDWMPVAARKAATSRTLKSGETLFRRGSKTAGLYEVVSGHVRLARVDRSGHEVVLHVAGPGEMLAEAPLFSAEYHCDAVASTNATARLYPKREVLAGFEKSPKSLLAFSDMLAHLVMNLRTRIEQRNIRSARDRLRHFLTINVSSDGRTVKLLGTLKDLAADLGLTHESLYRTMAELERSGEIRRKSSDIILLNRV